MRGAGDGLAGKKCFECANSVTSKNVVSLGVLMCSHVQLTGGRLLACCEVYVRCNGSHFEAPGIEFDYV